MDKISGLEAIIRTHKWVNILIYKHIINPLNNSVKKLLIYSISYNHNL